MKMNEHLYEHDGKSLSEYNGGRFFAALALAWELWSAAFSVLGWLAFLSMAVAVPVLAAMSDHPAWWFIPIYGTIKLAERSWWEALLSTGGVVLLPWAVWLR